jgi:hypothetical protein
MSRAWNGFGLTLKTTLLAAEQTRPDVEQIRQDGADNQVLYQPGDARNLCVQWLSKCKMFKFNDYDGSALLSAMGDLDYVTA